MKKIFWVLICILSSIDTTAQEFNCKVIVNTPKLQTVDPKVFKTLQTDLTNLVNTTKWTSDVFEQQERIQMSLTLNITDEVSPTSFKAELAIQASRPIFGGSYETVLFAYSDKDVGFVYEEYQPMEFSSNVFNNNLSSIVAFYCYFILGLDYDSFSTLGGDPHFQEAQNIVSTIPSDVAKAYPGWTSLDGQRNRYWLIENVLNPRVNPMRKAFYTYHRLGLDLMSETPADAAIACATALTQIAEVNLAYRNTMIVQIFAQTKSTEILQIFSGADATQKARVYKAMVEIDAANASKYTVIRS